MTELEAFDLQAFDLQALENRICELKALLDESWRRLSRSSLTSFERRELRNEMKSCSAELQRCLEQVRDERSRSRTRLPVDRDSGLKRVEFRLIG